MCSLLVNQNVFHHLLLNKYLNIFLIKHLLTWIYFRLWLVVVDISWLSVGGGGWWWIYCGWWWLVVDIFWLVVGGGIVQSNLKNFTRVYPTVYNIIEKVTLAQVCSCEICCETFRTPFFAKHLRMKASALVSLQSTLNPEAH